MKTIITNDILGPSGALNQFRISPRQNEAGEIAGIRVSAIKYGDWADLTKANVTNVLKDYIEYHTQAQQQSVMDLHVLFAGKGTSECKELEARATYQVAHRVIGVSTEQIALAQEYLKLVKEGVHLNFDIFSGKYK